MKRFIQIVLGCLLGGVSMWWACKDVTWASLNQHITSIRLWDALGVAALFMLQQLMRAYRQMLLLPRCGYRRHMMVLCVSFFFINTLPARIGELMRPILLKKTEGIEWSASLAMVFTERLLDLISAALLALIFLSFAQVDLLTPQWHTLISRTSTLLLPLAIIILVLFFTMGQRIQGLLPHRFQHTLQPFWDSYSTQRSALPSILMWTCLIWAMTPLMFVMGGWSFGYDLQYLDGVGILGCTMLGMAAPNAPGFAGTYEAAFMAGLILTGSQSVKAFAFAFSFHWWVYIVQSLSALYFWIHSNLSFRDLWKQLDHTRSSSSANTGNP